MEQQHFITEREEGNWTVKAELNWISTTIRERSKNRGGVLEKNTFSCQACGIKEMEAT